MKFFDSIGGRKMFGFLIVGAMAFIGMWFGKLDSSAFTTVILGDFAVYTGGNILDYKVNKGGGKK
jgi:hypothetical protein